MESKKREFTKIGKYVYDPSSAPLGSGTFGVVYKGAEFENKANKVAIKVIRQNTRETPEQLFKRFEKEIGIMKTIKGKNLLEYKHSYSSKDGTVYIITKFYKDGNLTEYLFKQRDRGEFSLQKALKILKLIAQTFCSLEKLDFPNSEGKRGTIMHRDIKPDNILMDGEEPILADFGMTKFISEESKQESLKHTSAVGTPLYMAPQLLDDLDYSSKCDVWSMGVVTYEMIFNIKPWTAGSKHALLKKIKETPLAFPDDPQTPEEVRDLIRGMLEVEEKNRLDWEKIFTHKALEKISV